METRYTAHDTAVLMRGIEDNLLTPNLNPLLRATLIRALWHGSRVLATIRDGEPCGKYLATFDYYHRLGSDMLAVGKKLA